MTKDKKARTRSQIGKELAKLRIDLDETVGQMVKRLGLHPTYLSRIESGSYPLTMTVASKIKEVYNVDFSHLVGQLTGRITFDLSEVSEADRKALLEIYERTRSTRQTDGAQRAAETVSSTLTRRSEPENVPDVDGVGFVGEDELSELDDLE